MLVLSRRQHERIIIQVPPSNSSQLIEVELVGIRPKQVQLGFQANRNIQIARKEITRGPYNPKLQRPEVRQAHPEQD